MAKSKKPNKKMRKLLVALCILLLLFLAAFFTFKGQYPSTYLALAQKYGQEYELDPYLIMAVIKTESGFRPEVVSKQGAVGLMQLLPSTAQWIAEKKGLPYEEGCLVRPEDNIRLGGAYLRYVLDLFGTQKEGLAAYNAGPGNVRQWLSKEQYSKDGVTLVKIPYKETENYVERVNTALQRYRFFYHA